VAAWRGWRQGCVTGVAAWRGWRRGCFAGVAARRGWRRGCFAGVAARSLSHASVMPHLTSLRIDYVENFEEQLRDTFIFYLKVFLANQCF